MKLSLIISIIFFMQFSFAAEYTFEDDELFNKAYAFNEDGEHEEAFKIYTKLAEKGHADAENNLGYMYKSGVGTEKDLKKAIDLYRRSANQDYVHAQVNLAFMYGGGYGTEKNYSKAIYWYKRASEQNFTQAQYSLGVIYLNGFGVEANQQEAMIYFSKACANNHIDSCFVNAKLNGENKANKTLNSDAEKHRAR